MENETEIVETESDITFCNPSTIEKTCEDCAFTSENETDMENHHNNTHEENKSEIEIEIDSEYQSKEEIFTTSHPPGLKSHITKMYIQKVTNKCEQCSESFETRKKLKIHIY